MPYKLDTHVHTREISGCARVSAAEAVETYKSLGYDGIVLTDHYTNVFFGAHEGRPWAERVHEYLAGYRAAKAKGQELGLDVFLGMELRFAALGYEDFLVYGVDVPFLVENPALYDLVPHGFKVVAEGNGLAVFQAHPFRRGLRVMEPRDLDGVETFNGNPRHDSNNRLAEAYAEANGLLRISGSDFHEFGDEGRGGVILKARPVDDADLAHMLLNGGVIELLGD